MPTRFCCLAHRTRLLSSSVGWLATALLLLVLLVACNRPATSDIVRTPDGRPHVWQPIFRGICLLEITTESPRPLKVYAIRADLQDPDIAFLVTPLPETIADGWASATTPESSDHSPMAVPSLRSMRPSTFLEKYRCQVAVNGSPFGPVVSQEGVPQQVMGLHLSGGRVISPPDPHRGLLLFTADRKVRITKPPVDLRDYEQGLGGFDLLLEDGQILPQKNQDLHPRTAAGLSKDRRHFYLLVIDGRQPSYSEGVTLHETALWLQGLGSWWAINLDGGGSSTLVIADPQGRAQVVNVPIDRQIPGTQRPSANHLGIYARPLP